MFIEIKVFIFKVFLLMLLSSVLGCAQLAKLINTSHLFSYHCNKVSLEFKEKGKNWKLSTPNFIWSKFGHYILILLLQLLDCMKFSNTTLIVAKVNLRYNV